MSNHDLTEQEPELTEDQLERAKKRVLSEFSDFICFRDKSKTPAEFIKNVFEEVDAHCGWTEWWEVLAVMDEEEHEREQLKREAEALRRKNFDVKKALAELPL